MLEKEKNVHLVSSFSINVFIVGRVYPNGYGAFTQNIVVARRE